MADPQSQPQSQSVDTSGWTDVPSTGAQPTPIAPKAPQLSQGGSQSQPTAQGSGVDTSGWHDVPPANAPAQVHQSFLQKLGSGAFNTAEDIAYPLVGAAAGGALGLVGGTALGPGAVGTGLGGAALGGVAGEELKRAVRANTGRGDLNPSGTGHAVEDLTAAAGGGAQEYSAVQKAATKMSPAIGEILPKVMEDAKALGIDLTPGTTGGKLLGMIESYVRGSSMSKEALNQTIDKTTNQSIFAAGSDLADSIAKASFEKDPQVLGNTLQQVGQQVKDAAQAGYVQSLRAAGKLNAGPQAQQAVQAAVQTKLNVADSMTASIVKKLMDSEEPENAAKYLLENGASLSHAQALKAAIGTQGQNVVSGGVLKELLNQSTNEANQTLNPSTLMAKWNDLGPAAQQALFPNQAHRDAIQTFLNVADTYAHPIATTPGAQGPSKTLSASGIGMAGVVLGNLMNGHVGYAIPVALSGLMVHFSAPMLLKVLQSPTMAPNLAKAITSPAGSYAQKGAIQLLTQFSQQASARASKSATPPSQ